jgi:KaiC/GvpD/RAD55 family RecA-like ATPase
MPVPAGRGEAGEKGLYVTLSETEEELREGVRSHGFSFGDRIEVFELLPPESLLDENRQQSLVYSSDLELGETTKGIFEAVERKARSDRARQLIGDPASCTKLATLPSANPHP